MSTLPLEVHEVLEEEYAALHGPVELPDGHLTDYIADSITDDRWVDRAMADCGFKVEGVDTLTTLNSLVADLSTENRKRLLDSPAITEYGRDLLAKYDDYTDGASAIRKREINRRILDEAMSGGVKRLSDVRLAYLYGKLHAKEDKDARAALCISGGGIRSATFALGVIQGLAGANILDKFHYLSTVSGGGYIGSWLSSWARRNREGMTGVQSEMVRGDTAIDGSAKTVGETRTTRDKTDVPITKLEPEAQPVRHLREYSNYLSPRLGLSSADTWTIAALYIRNLLLNLLVLVPLLAVVLAFPRAFAWLLEVVRYKQGDWLSTWHLLTTAVVFIGIGFAYLGSTRPVEHGRKAERRKLLGKLGVNSRFVVGCVLPLLAASTALALFWSRAHTDPDLLGRRWFWWNVEAGMAVMMLAPFFRYYSRLLRASASERREAVGKDRRRAIGKKALFEFLASAAGIVTNAALLVLLAKKVFDKPVKDIIDLKDVPALMRPLFDAMPVSAVYLCLSVPLILLVFFVQASVFVGLASKVNEDYDREWWGRAGAWLLLVGVLLGLFSFVSVFGPVLLYRAPVILGSLGGASGALAALVGHSAKTSAKKDGEKSTAASAMSGVSSALLVPLFVLVLLAAISLGTTWLTQQIHDPDPVPAGAWEAQFDSSSAERATLKVDNRKFEITTSLPKAPVVSVATSLGIAHLNTVKKTELADLLILIDVALVAYLLSHCIGVNRFSMHAFYRNRLIRAYLGASRYNRDPDKFTGFDANDNLQMYELRADLLWPSMFETPAKFMDDLLANKESNAVAKQLWAMIDPVTQNKIKGGDRTSAVVDSVTQHLNVIICDRDIELAGTKSSPEKRAAICAALPGHIPPPRRGPMHVVNTTMNLTTGENLAWQQRMAESFTVSPLHSGSLFLGYRDSREYGGDDGISLGNAVTISGAAASPNQGYNSSLPLAFLLTLLNVRLGAWLGNPGTAGEDSYYESHPDSNLGPLFAELLGMTSDNYEWIYLSDGGHFENLALYEMVLRRCRFIVVSDGGCDPSFSFDDLGNAIRKIRTDLGVPIDLIEEIDMFPRVKPGSRLENGSYMAKGTIRYSAIDGNDPKKDGMLIYLKPSIYKGSYLPRDVYNYAQQSETFPHETTADQFFSESQFESYRALGRYVVNVICGNYESVSAESKAIYAEVFDSVGDFVKFVPRGKRTQRGAQLEVTTTKGDMPIAVATGDSVRLQVRQ